MSGYIKERDCSKDHKNKNHENENHKGKKRDRCTKKTDPKPKKILLECGQNLEPARFDVSEQQTFTLGRVIVDTSCLGKPEVKIEFSSIVFFQSIENGATRGPIIELTFKVIRSSGGNLLPQIVFEKVYRKRISVATEIVEEVISSEPFSFSFCEKLDSSKCFEYVVEVTGNTFKNIGTAEVNDLSLGAFAQGVSRGCD